MRDDHLTSEHQRQAGKGRAAQSTFLEHNRQIAPDGFSAFSAYMRAPMGLRLLDPAHIQFLRPEQVAGKGGIPLSAEEQRLQFGCYVWRMIWEHIPDHPPPPTDEVYLGEVRRVQNTVGHGQSLDNDLDGVYLAPNDFCDTTSTPLSWKKQRKLFRAALRAACDAALLRNASPRNRGQRRPMQDGTSLAAQKRHSPRKDAHYGRPDLPPYAKENISPTRPYSIPQTAKTHAVWFTPVENADE